MKTVLTVCASCLLIWLHGCGSTTNLAVEPPTPNADSLRCVQAWTDFQLPQDTIIQLGYQQPVTIANATKALTITVVDIDDRCSEESAKDTYGCDARIKLTLAYSGNCTYQTLYPLTISRYGDGQESLNTRTFSDFSCKVGQSNTPISNGPSGAVLAFFSTIIGFRRLLPFAKTQVELNQLASNKQQYAVTLWLKKRCF